jgi:uncharacterized damage-inducible protein DinB
MTDGPRFAEQLRKGHDDDPWHGSPTAELLRGLSAVQAAAHPVPGAHGIWEIVLHMTGWQGEVLRRIRGGAPGFPEEGDWPEVGEPTEPRWAAAQAALREATLDFQGALATLTDGDLDRPVGVARDRPLGAGVTVRDTLFGILQHNAYHSGQIALLRKALEAT